ncbi:hypothetical protein ALMP_71870 [Streptomyces sp. A012304]|nr:hypothetical protein ALMP_71870 [Streptomyces sp. A012304]
MSAKSFGSHRNACPARRRCGDTPLVLSGTTHPLPTWNNACVPDKCVMWLLDGLAGADLIELLVRAASAGSLRSTAARCLPLVAQDRDGQVIGTLLSVPSGTLISACRTSATLRAASDKVAESVPAPGHTSALVRGGRAAAGGPEVLCAI